MTVITKRGDRKAEVHCILAKLGLLWSCDWPSPGSFPVVLTFEGKSALETRLNAVSAALRKLSEHFTLQRGQIRKTSYMHRALRYINILT